MIDSVEQVDLLNKNKTLQQLLFSTNRHVSKEVDKVNVLQSTHGKFKNNIFTTDSRLVQIYCSFVMN